MTPDRADGLRRAARSIVAAALLLGFVTVAAQAQGMLRFVGSVQWIAGNSMQVMTDTGASVVVDLTQADQSSYRGLRTGDAVVVDGYLSADRRRIVAEELWRDSGRGYWSQSP